MIDLQEKEGNVTLRVRVQARASRTSIRGVIDGALRIGITAPPVDGEANEELTKFIAKRLEVGREKVTITSGRTSRNKTIVIRGIEAEEVRRAFAEE